MKNNVQQKRFMFSKNLIVLAVMLVVIIVAIFAWFTVNRTVTATGSRVSVQALGDVKICLADDLGNAEKNGSLYDFKDHVDISALEFIKDATSDGQSFIIPAFSVTQNKNEGKIVNLDAAHKTAVPYRDIKTLKEANPDSEYDYHYLTYEFYIRSDTPDVRVRESSYVASGLEITNSGATALLANTNNNDQYRPAKSYGVFSADAIVGAIRLSFVGTPWSNGTLENYSDNDYDDYKGLTNAQPCQFLWLPRPDLFLDTSNSLGSWELVTGVTQADRPSNYKHKFYKASGENAVIPVELNKGANTVGGKNYYLSVSDPSMKTSTLSTQVPTLGESKTITDFNYAQGQSPTKTTLSDGTGSYYLYRYTLNIWIEGSDPEARRAMDQGQFRINLVFSN